MAGSRETAVVKYLRDLVEQYEVLEAERQILLDPAARLAELNAERQTLIDDAQSALDKYNALAGTSYTLAQIRAFFKQERSA